MRSASSSSVQSTPRSTEKRWRSMFTPESAIFSLTRTLYCCSSKALGGCGDAGLDEHALRGADPGAVLDLVAELRERHLEPRERGQDVEGAEVAAVRDPDDPALELVLAAVGGDPKLAQGAGDLAAVDRVGQLDGGHDRAALVGVAEDLEPDRLGAGAGRAGQQLVAGEDVLQPLLEDHVERDVEAEEERHGGRERGVASALGLEVLGPVEVVAAARLLRRVVGGALGDAREPEPGRAHQRLLRPGDDHLDPPLVLAQLGGAE